MKSVEVVSLKPINIQHIAIRIVGITPLIQHQWSEKALRQIREKHAGKKTKERDIRNPEQEAKDALYTTDDGKPGIPLLAIKSSLISAAHKDIGIEKTLVRKALFIKGGGTKMVLPMECDGYAIREDCVTVGMGGTDLRYRPMFNQWALEFVVEFDSDLLNPSDIINLVNRAGFGIGIGEWRPEKGGEFGRFKVATTA